MGEKYYRQLWNIHVYTKHLAKVRGDWCEKFMYRSEEKSGKYASWCAIGDAPLYIKDMAPFIEN